jgi:signal transduction histidine kinase
MSMSARPPIDLQMRAEVIALIDKYSKYSSYSVGNTEIAALRKEVIALARQSSDPVLVAEALLWRYKLMLSLQPLEMKAALDEARALYAGEHVAAGLAHCDAVQAHADEIEGKYEQALFNLHRAIPLLGGLRHSARALAGALGTICSVCHSLSMYDEVIRAGISLAELAKSSGLEWALDRGNYYQILGKVCRLQARFSAEDVSARDDGEAADLLASLRVLADDEAERHDVASMAWAHRFSLTEMLSWLGRAEEAAAVARSIADSGFVLPPGSNGSIALLLHGPDRCIDMLRPLIESEPRTLFGSELRSVLDVLASAYERRGDFRAALRAIREELAYAHADATRSAKTQAALFSLELEAERETLRAQQALAHAGKLAAVGQLASSLAHEISQPAAALMLLCSEARSELKAQRWSALAECLRDTEAQVRRLSRLVGRMQEFSKDDPVHLEALGLRRTVDEGFRLCKPALGAAELNCRIDVPDVTVRADKERMMQALVNLINNALDALRGQQTPAPMLRIEAETVRGKPGICLSVIDNGPGLSAAVMGRIFQPFFTTKTSGAGLGLGLTITREALRGMGATLEARNEPAGGARFSVHLPAVT